MSEEKKLSIFAVSDATGELAVSIATAALKQFKEEGVPVYRRVKIRTPERIAKIVSEAKEQSGFIVFTLVSHELRQHLLEAAARENVMAIDVMGPVMENLAQYIHKTPSDQPGLQYQAGESYRRNEAIDFAVKHDDGLGLETLDLADVVLLGISRTSKTPLSMYLAYRGFKTANVPIVPPLGLPEALRLVSRRKLVGLTISGEKLVELRSTRLARLGRPRLERYANLEAIREELVFANKIFNGLGPCPVIDVTSKAIEEIASEILMVLGI